MCVGDTPKSMIAMGAQGELLMAVRGLDHSCSQGRHFAVVNTESPRLASSGWVLILVAFVLQILSIEKPLSVEDERKRLRKLKKLAA
jgi:hypothetical protein